MEDVRPQPLIDIGMYTLTPYPLMPIGNFIGAVLALLPVISQIRKLSLAVWGYTLCIATYDFIIFVDSIIWHNNNNIVPSTNVRCDISEGLRCLFELL